MDVCDWVLVASLVLVVMVIASIAMINNLPVVMQSMNAGQYRADMKACDVKGSLCERNECRTSVMLQYGKRVVTQVSFVDTCGC
jgi:hypothetical protein